MAEHKLLPITASHKIHCREYADDAARLAASDLTADDLKKVVLQEDDNTYWVIIAVAPLAYVQISHTPHQIGTKFVDEAAIADNKFLKYDISTGNLVYAIVAISSDFVTVHVTGDYTVLEIDDMLMIDASSNITLTLPDPTVVTSNFKRIFRTDESKFWVNVDAAGGGTVGGETHQNIDPGESFGVYSFQGDWRIN